MFVEPGRFQDVIAQGKPSFLPGINKAAYGSARSAHRGCSHSLQASQAQPQGVATFPVQPAAPRHLDGVGSRQDRGEGCWGHGPLVRSKLPGTEEKGKGPRIPSASGSGPRSSLQMAQGFSPRPPAMGQPACTWHCSSGCCQGTVSSSHLERWGHNKLSGPGTLSLM